MRGWRRAPRAEPAPAGDGSLLALAVLAVAAGAISGLVVAMFRLALAAADRWREAFLTQAHHQGTTGFVAVVLAGAAAVGFAAWLVKRFSPYASGSGIPQVELALTGELPPAPPHLVGVKFLGGWLAIGAGMALGREGPSVQMGAVVADLLGKTFGQPWAVMRTLLAAGAGAGLAVAFNAPIAGAIFVLEELVRRLETRIAIAALGASSSAILVARLFLGNRPDFQIAVTASAASVTGPLPYAVAAAWPLYLGLGILCGLAAALYNRSILGAVALAVRLDRHVPVELQAALIGAALGALGWFAPGLVGGGELINQRLLAGEVPIVALPLGLAVRWGLGAVSYAARTPGGLFAPMLVVGAQIGLLAGAAAHAAVPGLGIEPEAFAVVGMAAFFTGVVQAPVTGIVLVTEMTAAFTTLLPMLAACFGAMVVANLTRTQPIYDTLRERIAKSSRSGA